MTKLATGLNANEKDDAGYVTQTFHVRCAANAESFYAVIHKRFVL